MEVQVIFIDEIFSKINMYLEDKITQIDLQTWARKAIHQSLEDRSIFTFEKFRAKNLLSILSISGWEARTKEELLTLHNQYKQNKDFTYSCLMCFTKEIEHDCSYEVVKKIYNFYKMNKYITLEKHDILDEIYSKIIDVEEIRFEEIIFRYLVELMNAIPDCADSNSDLNKIFVSDEEQSLTFIENKIDQLILIYEGISPFYATIKTKHGKERFGILL